MRPGTESVCKAVSAAEDFLIAAQDSDGLWRDYFLPSGPSTSWTSAYVAWTLFHASLSVERRDAIERSRLTIQSHRISGRWGYNSKGEPDADTTAWVIRLTAKLSDPCANDAAKLLAPFVSDSGGVRTFSPPERFGIWAEEHADVTPNVGSALVESASDKLLIARLRAWCLEKQRNHGGWDSFWWSTNSYALARNLEFLDSSGGIPATVKESCRNWLLGQSKAQSAFEGGHLLLGAVLVGAEKACLDLVDDLLASQMHDGSWPASSVLQVPHQWDDAAEVLLYADCKRLMSTATALQALRSWLRDYAGTPLDA